jgi:hypothetical protein
MGALRTGIKTHPDAGLYGWRHPFLSNARESTDFTLQYTAGHDNIKTTMRYVHPQANAVPFLLVWRRCEAKSFAPMVRCNKVVTKMDTPRGGNSGHPSSY